MGSLVSSEFWESSVCARPLGKAHATQYSRSSGKPLPRSAWRLPWLPRSWGKRSTVFEMLLSDPLRKEMSPRQSQTLTQEAFVQSTTSPTSMWSLHKCQRHFITFRKDCRIPYTGTCYINTICSLQPSRQKQARSINQSMQ